MNTTVMERIGCVGSFGSANLKTAECVSFNSGEIRHGGLLSAR